MPSLAFVKRDYCYGYNCTNSWNWARWIFFALFIIALLLLFLSAIRINKRRGQQGIQPMRGTAWMTPPSYQQQQPPRQEPFVPPYTEQANDQDMGYYDNQGAFHVNSKAKDAPSYRLDTLVPDQTGVSLPQPATTIQGTDPSDSFNRDFNRYYGDTAGAGQRSTDEYARPQGPPPAHLRQ